MDRSRHATVLMSGGIDSAACAAFLVDQINRAIAEYTDNGVRVVAPFIEWTKREVYDYFVHIGLPIELTYSCESGGMPTCGKCASCLDRKALQC
jgi:7-cyano-7-deazaguanine synthase